MKRFGDFDEQGNMAFAGRICKGVRGIVSAGRAEAASIGRDILAQGGNAIDAAVAATFALGVCEPNCSGIGGGGVMLLREGKSGKYTFLDFRGDSSAAATPGEVAGLLYALERYGTMTPRQVISPAARLARKGYVVTPLLHNDMFEMREQLKADGDGEKIYLNHGQPRPIGCMLKNLDLANTLEKISVEGADALYKGTVARKIVEQVRKDGGLLTCEDLAGFKVRETEPVQSTYRGYTVISAPPYSSGGVPVGQILNVLENFDIASLKIDGEKYLHLLSEVFKLCNSASAAYMGETDTKKLLSKDFAGTIAKRVDLEGARKPDKDHLSKQDRIAATHLSVADAEGNLVAVTCTLNRVFGSCAIPEGTGFLMKDMMKDHSVSFSSANAAVGKRASLFCMSPTFLVKDGKPIAVLGSNGGIYTISGLIQVISAIIDHDMSLEAAVALPRMGYDHAGRILYESRMPSETIAALHKMEHPTFCCGDWYRAMGSVNGCFILPDGTFLGVADPRMEGLAMGL